MRYDGKVLKLFHLAEETKLILGQKLRKFNDWPWPWNLMTLYMNQTFLAVDDHSSEFLLAGKETLSVIN